MSRDFSVNDSNLLFGPLYMEVTSESYFGQGSRTGLGPSPNFCGITVQPAHDELGSRATASAAAELGS